MPQQVEADGLVPEGTACRFVDLVKKMTNFKLSEQ